MNIGPLLLVASSDGKVSVVEFKENGTTSPIIIDAHAIGVNSASWAPATIEEDGEHNGTKESRKFVTGGADNLVKIWKYNSDAQTYVLESTLEGHSDWVRDVAWSPTVLLRSYLASVSQDRTCIIWTQDNEQGPWKKTLLKEEKFPDVLWRASWSLSGNVLALSGGDNKVTLWKENLEGKWEPAGEVHQ
ncbi:Sec13p [Saccharomyces cerevisiae FostersB]|nr:Sec13p [Saccharomyces cerevisiae FostersB]